MSFKEDRLTICSTCPYNMDNSCILCGCPLDEKTSKEEEFCPHTPSFWGPKTEPKVYKQAQQVRIAGQAPKPTQQSNECIPCKNRH